MYSYSGGRRWYVNPYLVLVVPVSLAQMAIDVLIQSSINPLHSVAAYALKPPLNLVRGRCVTWAHDWKLSVVTSSKLQQCQLLVVSARKLSAASSAR